MWVQKSPRMPWKRPGYNCASPAVMREVQSTSAMSMERKVCDHILTSYFTLPSAGSSKRQADTTDMQEEGFLNDQRQQRP